MKDAAYAIHCRIHGEGVCEPPCELCREVQGLLEDHAHELAEKIRTELAERVTQRISGLGTISTHYSAQHAAYLDDPEA